MVKRRWRGNAQGHRLSSATTKIQARGPGHPSTARVQGGRKESRVESQELRVERVLNSSTFDSRLKLHSHSLPA
jgi:hypothetical protein